GLIGRDIQTARELHRLAHEYTCLQPGTQSLSITTFRYVPPELNLKDTQVEEYLNALNANLLDRLQQSGEAYLSNAMVNGKFLLRAAALNFRTTRDDLRAILEVIVRFGMATDCEMRESFFGRQANSSENAARE